MRHRATVGRALTLIGILGALASGCGASSTPPAGGTGGAWTPPRTPWGDPDLQGVWRYEGAVALERPKEFEGRELLKPEEIAERDRIEKEQAANRLPGLQGA